MFDYVLQIVAVILCNTGIALLAYMDGITRSPTLGGVVLAAAASAGSAVYKVNKKKVSYINFVAISFLLRYVIPKPVAKKCVKKHSNFTAMPLNETLTLKIGHKRNV